MKTIIAAFEKMQQADTTRDLCPELPYLPKDRRLEQVVCTETHLSFQPQRTLEQWRRRRDALKRQIQIAAGLYPYPEKTPLRPRIFDEQNYGDYTVSKFMIESYPGFFVTGNLFRPVGKSGPFPAILNPHGHWDAGRNEMGEDCSVPARCANFAKMGMVAVNYDMVGYQDSRQVTHGFGQSVECQKWAATVLGLQLWNSIRVLDFVDAMPDVDSARIGCTGASGGGTQTFLLAALEERIAAAAPVNMVGLLMQGGCACENAPLLRIDTNNLELVSMIAPRPLLLVGSTGDWTCDLLTVDEPAVRSVYALYGAENRLEKFFHDADHNYNFTARYPVYRFFSRCLLARDETWIEQPVSLDAETLRIFHGSEKPECGVQSNEEMLERMKRERAETVARRFSMDPKAADFYRAALSFVLNLQESPVRDFEMRTYTVEDRLVRQGFVGTDQFGERIPFCSVQKAGEEPKRCVLLLDERGKYAALSGVETPQNDTLYVSIDMFLTGAYCLPWGKSGRNVPLADFFTAFNYTDDVLMADDIWNTYCYLKTQFAEIDIQAQGKAAELACLLAAFIPEAGPYLACGCDSLFVPCLESIGGMESCKALAEQIQSERSRRI